MGIRWWARGKGSLQADDAEDDDEVEVEDVSYAQGKAKNHA